MIDNLRHIRAFLAVSRMGNFTRAAAELRISQSALTVQVKQLESDLGITLFDRGKRRVSLTQAGRDVLVPLERLLIDAEEVVSRTSQLSGLRRGIVALAVLPSIATLLIPLAVQRFTKLYPGVVVQIRDVVAEKVIGAVKAEAVDFGIGVRSRRDRELRTVPLLVDRLFAFVPESHAFAAQRSVSFRQMASSHLILTGPDSSVREIVEYAFRRESLPLSFAYETNYMSTALGLVNAGLGVAILPEAATGVDSFPKTKRLPIQKPELSRKIDLIQKKDRSLSPAALKMVEIIKELAAKAP
jgi:LysR family transcriptional regulator, carnitine catabolism transcriptional activator